MKWYCTVLLASLTLVPGSAIAQKMEVVPIGSISRVESPLPTTWAMSGMDIIHLSQSDGSWTPIMRSLRMDARTVEILSRTQAPPLSKRDIRNVVQNGRHYVMVRRYLLAEVHSKDARAEHTSIDLLAQKWTRSVQTVLPQVAPLPNRYGI